MKKVIIVMGIGLVILGGISSNSFGETGKGFYLGIGGGTFPVWIFNSYHVSGEIGYRFSKRFGIVADVGYGLISIHNESNNTNENYPYSRSSTTTYSSFPVSGSLIISTPVGENFIGYVGLGLGYYKLKTKMESTHQNSYSGTTSDTDESESKGFAPHISIGMEWAVSQQITIFGELKHIVGNAESEETDGTYYSKDEIPFGGSVARIGLRIYF